MVIIQLPVIIIIIFFPLPFFFYIPIEIVKHELFFFLPFCIQTVSDVIYIFFVVTFSFFSKVFCKTKIFSGVGRMLWLDYYDIYIIVYSAVFVLSFFLLVISIYVV